MAYTNPLAVRGKQVKANVNFYQKAAIDRTAKRFNTSPSTLGYLWMWEPDNPISKQTRDYCFSIVGQISDEDIYECA